MKKRLKGEKLAVLAVLFLVVMHYPVLDIANKAIFIGSFPLLYVYLLVVWLLFIIVLAAFIYIERRNFYREENNLRNMQNES